MKKYSKYIAFAALALTFAACTQEEDFIPQGDADAVKISANIGKLQTRVSYDAEGYTAFDVDDQIRVQNTLRTSKNIATYTLTDEGWNTTDAFVWNSTSLNQFQAWYPVTNGSSYNTFTLPTNQSDNASLSAADWMTASTGEITKPENNTLNLAFQHRLAKVTVNITEWKNEFTGTEEITVPKIYTNGTDVTADYENGSATITATGGNTGIDPLVSDASFTAIVAPVKYAITDKFMTFTVNEREMTVSAKASQLTGGLEAGQHYTFSLTVGKDVAEITSVSVKDWTENPIVDNPTGSEATEVFIHSTVSGTTAAIDIVSGASERVQTAISDLLADNTEVTTLTVNGAPTAAQQEALAAALAGFNGTLIMDITEVSDVITNLSCKRQLGGYTYDETTMTYTVYTEAGLNKWKEEVEKGTKTNLTLGADIILSTEGITVDENGKPNKSNWIVKEIPPFEGSLEGGGHSIVNLRIISSGIDPAGFIGKVAGATIKNLTIVNPVAYGRKETQAGLVCVVGISEHPTSIINCHVQGGSIGGAASFAGGLIGLIRYNVNKCYIYGCTNSAKVTGRSNSGGILGDSPSVIGDDVVIAACANTGEISGGSKAGGIAGTVHSQEKLIACYTTQGNIYGDMDATVTGSYYVASADTDGEDGTTAVTDAEALNSTQIVTAMNAAIDTYNSSATTQVTYKWKVGTTIPELEAVTVSE